MVVRDSGVGIRPRPEVEPSSLRLGLSLIAALSSSFSISGGLDRGTEVEMRVPLQGGGAEEGGPGSSVEQPADATELVVGRSELLGPVLARVVGALAARRDLSVDRVSDAVLLTDAIAAAAPGRFADGRVKLALADADGRDRAAPRPDGGRAARSEIREELEVPEVGGSLEALADEFDGRGSRADGDYLAIRFSSACSCSLTCSRIRSRARRRIRETCICEWPIRSAICDCVMSSTKRRRRTRRSRSSRWGRAASSAILPSTSSKSSSSSPIHSAGVASSASSLPVGRSSESGRRLWFASSTSSTSVGSSSSRSAISPIEGERCSFSVSSEIALSTCGHAVVQAARDPHRPGPVAEVAFQLAEDRRRGEGGEGDAALGVEAVDALTRPRLATWSRSSKDSLAPR